MEKPAFTLREPCLFNLKFPYSGLLKSFKLWNASFKNYRFYITALKLDQVTICTSLLADMFLPISRVIVAGGATNFDRGTE